LIKRRLVDRLTHGRRLKSFRRKAHALVDALDLPADGDITTVHQRVSAQRGRPIQLIPMPMSHSGACGLWIATREADLVFHESMTSPRHQHHIIAHELAHMLCGHTGIEAIADESARLLFPDLDPNLVREMLGRSGYQNHDEQEAEIVATIMLECLVRPAPVQAPAEAAAGDYAMALARIDRSLRR
jgi:hypothetical protein